jgi:hypothetical protein
MKMDYRPAVASSRPRVTVSSARIFAATKKKVNSFFSRGIESNLAIRLAPD